MPHGDQTGPTGQGPAMGRGMGHCAGREQPGFANRAPGFPGRGAGRGWGGRGFRNQVSATGLTGWQRAIDCLVQATLPRVRSASSR